MVASSGRGLILSRGDMRCERFPLAPNRDDNRTLPQPSPPLKEAPRPGRDPGFGCAACGGRGTILSYLFGTSWPIRCMRFLISQSILNSQSIRKRALSINNDFPKGKSSRQLRSLNAPLSPACVFRKLLTPAILRRPALDFWKRILDATPAEHFGLS